MPDGGAEVRVRSTMGGDPRPPGRSAILKVIVVLVVVFATAFIAYQLAYGPLSWGREGDLELSIALDAETMPLNGSVTCTYTLTNTGDADLRVLPPWFPSLSLFDSNNTSVGWVGPVAEPPPPDTNRDLVTIKAGEGWSMEVVIGASRWDLRANETYRVVATYRSREEGRVTLPYWRGERGSNEVHFSVVG